MKRIQSLLLLLSSAASLSAQTIELKLNPQQQFQTIQNFGASDAWTLQEAGLSENAQKAAELLFSTEMDSTGNPMGIGLSLWRFNLGAGSKGDENIWKLRDSESFLQSDGTYDWEAQEGQRRFLQMAAGHGVEQFVLFSNSPPVNYTKNGKAYGDGKGKSNLLPEKEKDFTRYLSDVLLHFAREESIRFTRVSPVNEPQWDWGEGNGQEGSPYRNPEIASLIRSLNSELSARSSELEAAGLHTEIELPEAAKISFLTGPKWWNRGYQLNAFFNPRSRNYLGDLDYVAPEIAAHSYFSSATVSKMIKSRQKLARAMEAYPDLEYWMSEYCILQGDGEVHGKTDIGGMKPALFTARMIHHDLTIANASSWQWWLGIGVDYSYNDGLLFWIKDDDRFGDSRSLWAMGNYSRFIRPGAVRIGLERSDKLSLEEQAESLMASAYLNKGEGPAVVVLVNYKDKEQTVTLEGLSPEAGWKCYITSDQKDLALEAVYSERELIRIPALSVVTLVEDKP